MYLLYSILLVFWGILLLPVFLYKGRRRHQYLPGIAQRFGRLPQSLRSDGRATVWFHACSVGETLSLEPIVENLRRRFPEVRFVFSTITETGQTVARERFAPQGGDTFYFPLDFAAVDRRVLDWIRPAVLIIVDTEIWPNLLHQARRRNIPVILLNGRISPSSFPYYRAARPVLRRVFRNYRILMMQSDDDARRISAIGAPQEKIIVTGNIKFDRNLNGQEANGGITGDLEAFFTPVDSREPLIVAGSTHAGEEQVLLEVLQRIRTTPNLEATRMLLAPRHPERFEEVAALIGRRGYRMRRRSAPFRPDAGQAEVLLLDTVGELAVAYRFATAVFIGGTLDRHGGGHSIMEPAFHSKAIVVGPSMRNFRGIVDEFRAKDGIRQIDARSEDRERQIEELTAIFVDLLQKDEERDALGKKAFSILEQNRGAAQRTLEIIASVFEETLPESSRTCSPAETPFVRSPE